MTRFKLQSRILLAVSHPDLKLSFKRDRKVQKLSIQSLKLSYEGSSSESGLGSPCLKLHHSRKLTQFCKCRFSRKKVPLCSIRLTPRQTVTEAAKVLKVYIREGSEWHSGQRPEYTGNHHVFCEEKAVATGTKLVNL
uniref:Uncharacterized protein n=1 Tax=Sphaerodactylus townsendi TaxID=933632 RepID=A0ACB8FJ47_9SAUR